MKERDNQNDQPSASHLSRRNKWWRSEILQGIDKWQLPQEHKYFENYVLNINFL